MQPHSATSGTDSHMQSFVDCVLAFCKLAIWGGLGNDRSIWTVLLIWIVRIASISLLFRQYVGPSVLRLVSKRLRVRSVSLRSIRGIYFRSGKGTLRVERIGISFHRLFSSQFSRIFIKIEGLQLEISEDEAKGDSHSRAAPHSRHTSSKPVVLGRRLWSIVSRSISGLYRILDPTVRPIVRSAFVYALQIIIKAIPALTHVMEFELYSATFSHYALPETSIEVRRARVDTEISLSQVENNSRAEPPPPEKQAHRRRFSVADLNARMTNSLRRAWDRAWGATRLSASITLGVKDVIGRAPCMATGSPNPLDCKSTISILNMKN